jgi:hypothetical protein
MVVIWLYNKVEALFSLHSIPDNPNGLSPMQVTMHARPTIEELVVIGPTTLGYQMYEHLIIQHNNTP